jgi:hypothetical protein
MKFMLQAHNTCQFDALRDKARRKTAGPSINDWRVSAYSLIIVSVILIVISSRAHGDEVTGAPPSDTKEMSYTNSGVGISYTTAGPSQPNLMAGFLAMPSWAHGATMPALPYQLTPMGKKPVVIAKTTSNASPAPAPLAPPKDTPAPAPQPESNDAAAKPAPAPEPPALIAVSPFLQWIKSNPKAADEAREQAAHSTAQAPPPPANGANTITAGPTANANAQDPYWLPPLIDSADFSTGPVGGSAAIYSTPQR